MANHLLSDDDIEYIVEQAFAEGVLWITQGDGTNAAQQCAIITKQLIDYLNNPIDE